MTLPPGNRSNAKGLRPERCVVLDSKPCAACTGDIKLEQEIQELEQTIEKLHNRRRALRTAMNENHDHLIHKFPPEIVSQIFIQYAPPSASRDKKDKSALRLGSVCQKWRQLAWATPQLWSSLTIGPEKVPLGLVAEWLERSASLPLSIGFYHVSEQQDGLFQLLNKHSTRWYDIHLDIPPTYFPYFDGSSEENILHRLVLCSSASRLKYYDRYPLKFSMKSEPRPTDLSLLGVSLSWVDIIWNNLTVASVSRIDVGDCLELIRRAPLLRTLRMKEIDSLPGIFPLPNTRIVHPHLHSLELLHMTDRRASVEFLNLVGFPSLQKWTHGRDVFLVKHMISFIEWSPRLKLLGINIDNLLTNDIAQLLGHLSTLEHLELRSFSGAGYHQIIVMLCASGESPLFLPRMQSLEFRVASETFGFFPWESLPEIFVSSRWRSLRVKVNTPPDVMQKSAKILRELIDKGFDLSIVGDGEIDAFQDVLQENKCYY